MLCAVILNDIFSFLLGRKNIKCFPFEKPERPLSQWRDPKNLVGTLFFRKVEAVIVNDIFGF